MTDDIVITRAVDAHRRFREKHPAKRGGSASSATVLADAYVELLDGGHLESLSEHIDKMIAEVNQLRDLLERARIILAEECGDNYYANCLIDEIEAALSTNDPKGGE